MEEAARRFARKVLMLHLLLLVGVIVVVAVASREIYDSARQSAMAQARAQQTLLVATTVSGIETYYGGILSSLELLKKAEGVVESRGTTAPAPARVPVAPVLSGLRTGGFAPILWNQINDRASHLLAVDHTGAIIESFAREDALPAQRIVADPQVVRWLQSVQTDAVSAVLQIDGQRMNLVAAHVSTPMRRGLVLVAVVPLEGVETRFLNGLNRSDTSVSAMLVDGSGNIMVHPDRRLLGRNMAELGDERLRVLVQEYLRTGKSGDEVLDRPVTLLEDPQSQKPVTLKPGLTRIEPIAIGGQRWWLVVSSGLAQVNEVVAQTFRRAMVWAGFVVVAMTAILVSTSLQLIRGRARLERARSEVLTREVGQAREIQLAWLPMQVQLVKSTDIAAINHPARHISGDFYNWFELPDGRLVVTIGDVTGHGMAAAFLMATTQLLVRMTMLRLGDPGQTLEEVNRQLCIQNKLSGQFVTMIIVVLDTDRGEVEIATAGHYPPLVSDGERFESLKMDPQLVLGVEPDTRFVTERFDLGPAASILLYTDGVLDVVAPDGSRFHAGNLLKSLGGRFGKAQEIIDRVVEAVTTFRGERDLPDDLTMVAIHFQTAGASREAEVTTV